MKRSLLSRLEALEKSKAGTVFEPIFLFGIPQNVDQLPPRNSGETDEHYLDRMAFMGYPCLELRPEKKHFILNFGDIDPTRI